MCSRSESSAERLDLVCLGVARAQGSGVAFWFGGAGGDKGKPPAWAYCVTLQADGERYAYVGSDQSRACFYPVSQHDFNYGGLAIIIVG